MYGRTRVASLLHGLGCIYRVMFYRVTTVRTAGFISPLDFCSRLDDRLTIDETIAFEFSSDAFENVKEKQGEKRFETVSGSGFAGELGTAGCRHH